MIESTRLTLNHQNLSDSLVHIEKTEQSKKDQHLLQLLGVISVDLCFVQLSDHLKHKKCAFHKRNKGLQRNIQQRGRSFKLSSPTTACLILYRRNGVNEDGPKKRTPNNAPSNE